MKFNVGDMVACIDIGDNWYGYVFIITDIDTKSNESSYLCECCTDGSMDWLLGKSLALVKEASEEKEKENNKTKIFKKESKTQKLGHLNAGDFFQILEDMHEKRYGFVCTVECVTNVKDTYGKQAAILLENEWPYYSFVLMDNDIAIKKLTGEIRVEDN